MNCELSNKNSTGKFTVNVLCQLQVKFHIPGAFIVKCNLTIQLKGHSIPHISLCDFFVLI